MGAAVTDRTAAALASALPADRFWDGFDAALIAVEEGQVLYGTTAKAVKALRVVSRIGREADEVRTLADVTAAAQTRNLDPDRIHDHVEAGGDE